MLGLIFFDNFLIFVTFENFTKVFCKIPKRQSGILSLQSGLHVVFILSTYLVRSMRQ